MVLRNSLAQGSMYRSPNPLGFRTGRSGSSLSYPTPASNTAPKQSLAFPKIDPVVFRNELRVRRDDPGLINQSSASLCGPSCLMHILATNYPSKYWQFGIDLYELGSAALGSLVIEPGEDCRSYKPDGRISSADWVTLASIRDSENGIFDYEDPSDEFSGITLPGELADWFESIGYHGVENETNLYLTKDFSDFAQAIQLFNQGYQVCLFIDANAVSSNRVSRGFFSQIATTANHWVVLRSISLVTEASVVFEVYTWGSGNHRVPQAGTMSMSDWLKDFYGYVAAKP